MTIFSRQFWGLEERHIFSCKAESEEEENSEGHQEAAYFTFSQRSNTIRCTTGTFYRTRYLLGKGAGEGQCKARIGQKHSHRPLFSTNHTTAPLSFKQ